MILLGQGKLKRLKGGKGMATNTIRRFYTQEAAENAKGVLFGAFATQEEIPHIDGTRSVMWVSVIISGDRAKYLRMNGKYE